LKVRCKNTLIANSPSNVTYDVGKDAALKDHANNDDNALRTCDWIEVSIADSASCGDNPVDAVNVLINDGGVLKILQTVPTLQEWRESL
jgi:hypothetical protein